MSRGTQRLPTRRTWDTDKAIRCTYKGRFGRYQLRSFLIICIVFSTTESWISSLVYLNAIPPKSLRCINSSSPSSQADAIETLIRVDPDIEELLPSFDNDTRSMNGSLTNATAIEVFKDSDFSQGGVLTPLQLYKDFNVSANESKRSILTEFGLVCGDEYKVMYARIGFIISKHLGSFLAGIIADKIGRKFPLFISALVSVAMILFQILSEDFVSYCFFMLFVGISSGAMVPVCIAYVMETSARRERGVYVLGILLCPCVADLVIPWISYGLRSWKALQVIACVPAIVAVLLYWWSEETAYFHVSLKQYIEAIDSLTRISAFNSAPFAAKFKEADEFKRLKMSKGVQCDFQPLLRLQDIEHISHKYPDVDFAELMEAKQAAKRGFLITKIAHLVGGKHYRPGMTEFYIFDYIFSPVVLIYFVIMCAMWFVNGLTCSSLDSHELSWRVKTNPYTAFCYSALTSFTAGLVLLPLVFSCSRRWAMFCSYLVVEVCLLASIVAKIEKEFTPITVTLIYLLGKVSTSAVYFLTCVMCAELFPTGLRCTTLGFGLLLRGIGLVLADPDLLNFHDWTSRLIYGLLSLVIGALALVIPDTRQYLLPRSFKQVEDMKSTVSKKFNQRTSGVVPRPLGPDSVGVTGHLLSDPFIPHEHQSTLHSIYDLNFDRHGLAGYAIDEEDDKDLASEHSQSVNDASSECDDGDDNNNNNNNNNNAPVHEPTQMLDEMEYRAEHDDAYFSENL